MNDPESPQDEVGEDSPEPSEIVEDAPEEVEGEEVTNLDDPEVQERIIRIVESHTGPIPHPSIAKGYEELMPGATDRLFSMVEVEGERRHAYAMEDLKQGHKSVRFGIGLTTVAVTLIAVAALVAAVIFVKDGANPYVVALILIAVSYLGLKPAFGAIRSVQNEPEPSSEVAEADSDEPQPSPAE
ncbi:MAG: DUF2335 domain-containing protein [Solirubrobacterales bacterium]|nr:DUF2335 domain-containing protein [Solirubrobacterales bacterium]